jgi:Asp-tRNA(Asn)/Glu-tRNA(Gln) amidotransferase A subunit family amidase
MHIENLLGRRAWLKLLPVLTTALAAQTAPPATEAAKPGEITRELLQHSMKMADLAFTDPELDMMLPSVNQALQNYRKLRQIQVPLDTEPATHFQPLPPGITIHAKYLASRVPHARRHGSVDDLAYYPVTQLSQLLQSRQVTSMELTRMYLARLKKHTPVLNCVITMTDDLALAQAAAADQKLRHHHPHQPLLGVPWGAKDLFATKGVPTTWGAEPYRNQTIDYDATVVERLRDAGAVLLAKLSMGSLAQGGLWYGGMTKNPWKTDETSSGSSAGSASASAAGLVGFALGTETLGSIISPSTRCGVAGLRPTYGRVSRHGAMGLSWTMDKVGPIARSAEDCALILNAIHGPDGLDNTVRDIPFHFDARLPLKKLRVGVLQSEFEKAPPEDKDVYTQALADLTKAGVHAVPVELPDFQAGALSAILNAEAAAAFDDLTRDRGIDKLTAQTPDDWPNQFRASRMIPARCS